MVQAPDAARQDVVEVLGTVGGVEVAVAVTSEPWSLPVDALVLSVGRALGRLAREAKLRFPDADWGSLRAGPVPIGQARVLEAGRPSASVPPPLRFFIAAGVGDSMPGVFDAIGRASAAAVRLAQRSGVAALAMPLLGTGNIGLEHEEAARVVLAAVGEQLRDGDGGSLRRLVFVGDDGRVATALAAAWRAVSPERPEPVSPSPSSDPGASVPPSSARLPQPDLSSSAVEVLGHAAAVAEDRPDHPGQVDGPLLLLSALTRRRDHVGGVSAVLARALAGDPSRLPDLLTRVAQSLPVPPRSLDKPPASPGDLGATGNRVVDLARGYARRTGVADVHVRHLLAAVVTEPLPPPVIEALETTPADLRRHLRAAIRDVLPDESPSVWDEILLEPVESLELAGGYSRDTVGDAERIPLDEDRLGVGTYVSMLATVIARRDTPLPLSVGLFGEWGSGKSYFMGLLRDRIHMLSRREDDAYWREIVPITFNAWHYADTNLWASLGNEIFEQLAGPGATAARQREALREELTEKTERAVELRAASERAEQEAVRLRKELDQARIDAARSKQGLVDAVVASPTVRGQLARAWAALGVSDDVAQGELLAAELRGAAEDLDPVRIATRSPRGRASLLAAAVALVGLLLSVVFAGQLSRFLAGGGLVALTGAIAGVTTAVTRARSGLQTLAAAAAEIRAQVEQSDEEEVSGQRDRLRTAEARASVLESTLSEVLQRVGQLGRELAELDPGRRWYGFVAERAASDDYRRELGLISTIRRDFERLIELLKDWQTLEVPDGRHRRIDRIVLYIDDLDRCSSKQVVDVLQAVHLLLALDLFVVVVGVDPRWLLHSLREQYRTAFRSSGEASAPDSDLGDQDAVWRTTPHDYLEKIFNIPFVLPGMTTKSFDLLIRKLSLGEEREDDADDPQAEGAGSRRAAARPTGDPVEEATGRGEAGGGAEQDVRSDEPIGDGELTDEGGSEVRTGGTPEGPVPRRLTEDELALVASLGPLVRSPRQAKRLLNLYRMVRSTRDLSPAAAFLGSRSVPGEYQAVGVLLGLLTAHPRLLGRILAAEPTHRLPGGISHRDPAQTWAEVVAGLRPRASGSGWTNDVCADMSEVAKVEWTELVERVAPATALVSLPDLTAFRFWGPRLARFSFVLAPLAVTEEPDRGTGHGNGASPDGAPRSTG